MPALYRANLFVFLQPLLRVWFAIRVESNITGCIDVFGHRSSHQLNGCSCKCSQSAFRETLVKIPWPFECHKRCANRPKWLNVSLKEAEIGRLLTQSPI
ncbi:Protein of unknown function [Pyronema omphalodes CBS 100304]|uniref:Secreted protein n=1 Tax=Pyronema omphalodes (strain CBS 100304) TaxID=1076935 RepID=U4LJW7_PYROM|nr:Protein of unknown function [Pyronema omphalodes CBS 100304]